MKRKQRYIILSFLFACLLLSLHIARENSKERIQHEVNQAFKAAVETDYVVRLEQFRYNNRSGAPEEIRRYITAPAFDRKIKRYTLRTKHTKTVYTFKDSVNERWAKRLLNETILAKWQPADAEKLNEIFRYELEERKIYGKTGVIYTHGKTKQYSREKLPTDAGCITPHYQIDLTGNVRTQAWVNYTPLTLLHYADSTFFWFLALLLAGGSLCLFYTRRKEIPAPEGIFIDTDKQELCIDGIRCAIPRLDLYLLHLFLENKGQCVSRETIKSQFWATDSNADEKIDTHIKILRKILRDFPKYRLVTVRGRGYYLDIDRRT